MKRTLTRRLAAGGAVAALALGAAACDVEGGAEGGGGDAGLEGEADLGGEGEIGGEGGDL